MDDAVTDLARRLLEGGFAELSDREQRVILLIAKRQHVARDVNTVLATKETFGERLADRVRNSAIRGPSSSQVLAAASILTLTSS